MIPKKLLAGRWFVFILTLGLGIVTVQAEVRLPKIFSDNMVLQQGMRTPVWGWADDGEVVTVTFRGETVKTIAKGGKWTVKLSKLKAGGPDTLTVNGKNSIVFKNVLVGEVWVCGGQSNMEFLLGRSFEAQPDIDSASNSMIRLIVVRNTRAMQPTNDIDAVWVEATPETAAKFSAVGYYFGRDLQKARGVPVGLIQSDWGGTPAEAWMSEEALAANSRYKEEILDEYPRKKSLHEKMLAKYLKEKAEAMKTGASYKEKAPGLGWRPAELYNGMIAPIITYGIKGTISYEGEANAGRAEQYRSLFPDLIRNWRHDWKEGEFPFLAVQLAPFMPIKEQPDDSAWAELRDAQLNATKVLPKVGIAVTTDVGNPNHIHPTKKKPVGQRLALAARAIAYNEKIEYSGPIYSGMKVKGSEVVLSFDHASSGLVAKEGELKGFAICGEDKKFVWAKADIDMTSGGKKVVVSSPQVPHPVAVRYGWADCPVVNLWNKDGLPASPFRTDNFPMVTLGKK